MHRPGCDLSETACERGVSSDMNILCSLDFYEAAIALVGIDRMQKKENIR